MSGGKNKQKTRSVRRTTLIYCEGAHDQTFVRHLVDVYAAAGRVNGRVNVKRGRGGSPDSLIIELTRVSGSFDRRLLKADKDRARAEIEKAEYLSNKEGIPIIWSKPCIEALLLTILDGKDYSGYQSKTCKQHFEARYIAADKRTDSRAYEKVFTVDVLEEARKRVPELDELIQFITGQN